MIERARIWWDAQKSRPNYNEFVGAVVRAGLSLALLTAYYVWMDWTTQIWVQYLYWAFVAYTLVVLIWIYRAKECSDFHRLLPLVVDVGTAAIMVGLTGERGAIVLFVFTWTAVAYGFRFGLRYFYIAWILSLGCFVLVYALSAAVDGYWYGHPLLWAGAFIWVAAPSFYVAQLLKQKLAAVQAAEEARLQLERASEAKSEFLATMSHEMRTPLNGVVGAAELLAGTDLPQRERQLVDWLLTSSRQLRSLIDNLLDLRKIEAGKMSIESTPLDLHVLMNRLAALFEPEAKRTHLRFTKSVSAGVPALLMGDGARLQQVLINLVANALKFTRQGFVRVSVAATAQTEQEVTLRFEVRDTGIGIPPENAGRIFDRFTQADESIHRQYGGSGLGTTICKHLVELMGGTIGFDSRPGIGTTFWFSVPLSRPPAEAYEDGFAVSIRDAHAYFVSRRPLETGQLAKVLRERQLELSSFLSAGDAIAAIRQKRGTGPSVMLVDAEGQDFAWREAPEGLRREGVQIPCVLLHPGVSETEAFDAGYGCLLKSRDPTLLVRAVRSVVAGSSSMEPEADFSGQETSGRKGLRVLVAEDNEISQQVISMMLQAGGHVVTLVGDGDGVLDSCRDQAFDVLVLDMHMPGRTGLEVAKAVRTLEAASGDRRLPIVMLTAAASTDLREESLDSGVDLFLSKPVDPRALLRSVAQVFREPHRAGSDAPALPQGREGCIDRVLLKDMAELARDPAFLQTLTRKFSAEAGQLLDLIEAAMVERDRPRFRDLTHALKGTAMMAGATRLRDSVVRAEKVADSDFDRGGAELLRDMKAALEATNVELSRMGAQGPRLMDLASRD